MDLGVKDVAELLNVTEQTVEKWLEKGMIPAYQLNKEFRFSRIEVENWMMQQNAQSSAGESKLQTTNWSGTLQYSLYRAIGKGVVLVDIEGKTKEAVIRASIEQIAGRYDWDASVLTDLLLDREELMPTALTNGVGVPHARELLFPQSCDVIIVVFPKNPIDYGALDGNKVHTLFFLFASLDKSHLHLLAKIAHLANNQKVLEFLRRKPEKSELLSFIKNWESQITRKEKALETVC